MKNFEDEDLRGGIVTHLTWTVDQHFKALVNFGTNPNMESTAALIAVRCYLPASTINKVRTSFNYTEYVVRPHAYKEFIAFITNFGDTTMIKPMGEADKTFGSYMESK